MHPAFARTDHRPWPHPTTPWTWRQSWRDLLFAHWPIDAAQLRPLVPAELTVQEYDGTSWIGLVPFHMAGVMRRPLPDLPWVSAFPELNVRIYVEYEGRPGVWFLSLDATNPLAVWAARTFFHLPYYGATMSINEQDGWYDYSSVRKQGGFEFQGRYRPTGDVYESQPCTLEHWLTERYGLFAQSPNGDIYSCDVHHVPWPLQPAELELQSNTMLAPHKLVSDDVAPVLHFAKRIDVAVWNPVRVLKST